MRSLLALILPVALLSVPSMALCQDLDNGGFEMWEDHQTGTVDPEPASAPSPRIAGTAVVGRDNHPPQEVSQSAEDTPARDYVILFGAGALVVVPYRVSDGAMDSRVLSEFSVSWAPFGIVGEIGADLAIAKDSSFLFRPNLKFYFVKHEVFSAYLEGSCAVYSGSDGTYVGGGGALGLLFGVMEHLAIELRAGGSALSMSAQASSALVDGAPYAENDRASGLVLLPAVSARVMARF
jgi:hypothetical protein